MSPMRTIITSLVLALTASLTSAANPGNGAGALPPVSMQGSVSGGKTPIKTEPAGNSKHKVKPGESYTNNDGVTVDNDDASGGNATIDPANGSGNSSTQVNTKTSFEGDISGLDSNDTVNLGSSNTANVSGTGGTVNVSGGSAISVSNTSVAGGGNMTVNLPSGSSITVGPGSNITVNT